MTALCCCGQVGRRHEITNACMSPDDQELVRRFAAEYDRADLGPWWHQAAGKDSPLTAQVRHNVFDCNHACSRHGGRSNPAIWDDDSAGSDSASTAHYPPSA